MSDIKNKFVVSIAGMHCRSCEILVEDSLSEISKIKKVNVNHKKGTAEIFYDGEKPSQSEIERTIKKAGYCCADIEKKPWMSQNSEDYKDLGIALFFLVGIWIIAKNMGIGGVNFAGVSGNNPSSLSVVFLVGITAGLSTCMALVGGLILGIAARHSEKHPKATPAQKFRPHLFFNLGRIGGYALLGGILGALGSALQFSSSTMGIMTILVGLVMLALGMKLTGLFPRMENAGMTVPKSVSRFFGLSDNAKEYSHRSSMITGALTFFLPCGFTQAMQLYAVSTGSFSRGALIMGVFALGTAPGLLSIGGLTSVVKGSFARQFFKFAGILVIFLAMFNISNGYTLVGLGQTQANKADAQNGVCTGDESACASGAKGNDAATNSNPADVQVINMAENASGYTPNSLTVKKGVPVKWVITANDPYSCASGIVVPSLGIRKSLVAGENVIEFTPTEAGEIDFSCSMGMHTGKIIVE